MSDSRKVVDVVASVVVRPDGRFLLARRPEGKPYAGYWEFPGGKVEPGESLHHALLRELHEELGIEVGQAHPWLVRHFDYAHASVKLHFFRVVSWYGELHGREGQILSWQLPGEVAVAPLLPANGPILRALELPPVYALSNCAELGEALFLERLARALERGLRLIQLREKRLPRAELERLARRTIALAHPYGARVLVNSDSVLAAEVGADGVHLTAADMAALDARPQAGWCGASCHSAEELGRAVQLGLDYVLLGPVLPTLSHPHAATLGWQRFSRLAADSAIPVYALGGVTPDCLETAQQNGAHGIAMLRAIWR